MDFGFRFPSLRVPASASLPVSASFCSPSSSMRHFSGKGVQSLTDTTSEVRAGRSAASFVGLLRAMTLLRVVGSSSPCLLTYSLP